MNTSQKTYGNRKMTCVQTIAFDENESMATDILTVRIEGHHTTAVFIEGHP
jgi:hypothetical protein